MIKTALTIAFLFGAAGSASAQTKDQCSAVANALSSLVPTISTLESTVGHTDWNLLTNVSSGQFRDSAQAAKLSQMSFVAAIREYRIALEDVARQGQLCAR